MAIATYKNLIVNDNGVLESDRNYQIFFLHNPSFAWNDTTKKVTVTSKYFRLNHAGGEGPYIEKIITPDLSESDANWTFNNSWLYDSTRRELIHTDGGTSILSRGVDLVNGYRYRVTFTLSDIVRTTQNFYVYIRNKNLTYTTLNSYTADGTYSIIFNYTATSGSSQPLLAFNNNANMKSAISNIALERVDENDEKIQDVITADMLFTTTNSWHFSDDKYWHLAGGTEQLIYDLAAIAGKQYAIDCKTRTGSTTITFGGITWAGVAITATNTNNLAASCGAVYCAITYFSVKEMDNNLSIELDLSYNPGYDHTPYQLFNSDGFSYNHYYKQVYQDIIIAMSNYYNTNAHASPPYIDSYTDKYRAYVMFDKDSNFDLQYFMETTHIHDDDIDSSGVDSNGHGYVNNIDEIYKDGYDLSSCLTYHSPDMLFALFKGTKDDYDSSKTHYSCVPYGQGWDETYRIQRRWQKYCNAKIFKFDENGISSFIVQDKVIDYSCDYLDAYYSGISGTNSIELHSFYSDYQIHNCKGNDVFWSFTYRATYRDMDSLEYSYDNYKTRYYKNNTFLEEVDTGSTEYQYLFAYLTSDNTILIVRHGTPVQTRATIIEDTDGNIVFELSGYDYIHNISEAENGDIIIISGGDIQEYSPEYYLRYDSEWNLVSSRHSYSPGGSYGNCHTYFTVKGDFLLQGYQRLVTGNHFKCIGGFRDATKNFLLSVSTSGNSNGNPQQYLGFRQNPQWVY